jgi:hypothetical protein
MLISRDCLIPPVSAGLLTHTFVSSIYSAVSALTRWRSRTTAQRLARGHRPRPVQVTSTPNLDLVQHSPTHFCTLRCSTCRRAALPTCLSSLYCYCEMRCFGCETARLRGCEIRRTMRQAIAMCVARVFRVSSIRSGPELGGTFLKRSMAASMGCQRGETEMRRAVTTNGSTTRVCSGR